MKDTLSILFVILMIWLIVYILLEITIINNKRKNIEVLFNDLDNIFNKRLCVLSKMLDIVKVYNKMEFEEFSSKLYDYISEYSEYSINKKLEINVKLELDVKKVLLSSIVYPELSSNGKYIKLEKQLVRFNKVIKKICRKYNNAIEDYEKRKEIFPSNVISKLGRFYKYDYFNLDN